MDGQQDASRSVDPAVRRRHRRDGAHLFVATNKRVASGEAGVSAPHRMAASSEAARVRASASIMAFASPTIFQMRCPRCWVWMKKRLAPDGIIRTPKPVSFASRMSKVEERGRSALTRASERVMLGMGASPVGSCSRGTGAGTVRFHTAVSTGEREAESSS